MKSTSIALLLAVVPAGAASLTGLWEFDNSANLAQATVGADLSFAGAAPGTWSATLADDSSTPLTGVITTAAATSANTISASHGIAPNGGGLYVNQWTVLVDIHSPVGSRSSWRTIFQTNMGNANDGDYFIDPSADTVGVGAITYSASAMNESVWTRLVVTFDLAASGPSDIRTYLNGSLFHTHTLSDGLDGRFSLDPALLFFSDNDGDNAPMNVGAIAMWDGALTAGEVSALGSAGASIVPEPSSALAGVSALLIAALRRRR